MKRKSILLLIPFAAMALAGCGEDPTPPNPCESAVVQLDKTELKLDVGQSATLTASMNVEGCAVGEIAWSSDHPEIAKVENGKVTALAVGTATITANGASCTVTVTQAGPVVVEKLNIEGTLYPNMVVGEKLLIKYTVEPADAANKEVTFTSDNTEVATVSAAGEITALAKGTAKITVASVSNPSVSKVLNLTVKNVSSETPAETVDGMKLMETGELQDGEIIILTGIIEDKYYSMPEYSGGNNIKPVEDTLVGEKRGVNANAGLFTVVKNADNSYSFMDSQSRYLSAAGGEKNNYLKVVTEIDATAKFSVNIADGFAAIVCTGEGIGSTVLALNYNDGNPLFSCYAPDKVSGHSKISIYHNESVGPVVVTAVQFEEESYDVMVGKTISATAHVVPAFADNKEITYSLADLSPAACATIDAATGEVTGVIEGSGKIIATSAENPEIKAEAQLTVSPLGKIEVDTELLMNHETIGTPSSYNDGGKDGYKFVMLTTYKDSTDQNIKYIQGNSSKSSVLWNELPFSKYIEKVVVTIGEAKQAGVNSTASFFFGASAECAEEIKVGKDTSYSLSTAGSFELTPTSDATFFKLVFTNGATYIESMKFVFKSGVVKELQGISASTTQDTYYKGQSLDKSKVEVVAHYNTGDENVTDYTFSPESFTEAGETIPVTISFGGKTDSFNVKVIERSLTGLAVSGDLTKKEYEEGDEFDPSGLTVTGTYDNGDIEEVTAGYTLAFLPEVATLGETTINVTASVGAITSNPYAITGLTINEKVVHVTGVSVEGYATKTVEVGKTFQLVASVAPEDATDKVLTYTADESGNVTVDESGLVTGVAEGTAKVTVASHEDPTKKKEITFSVIQGLPGETSAGFVEVSKAEDLINGKLVQFYAKDLAKGIFGMGYNPSSTANNQPGKAATITDNKIVAGEDTISYKLIKNADETFSFLTPDGKYLAATGGKSSNYLKTVTEINDKAKFNISISDSGVKIQAIDADTERNTMSLNASVDNPLFACYTAANAASNPAIHMYVKDVMVETVNLSAVSSSFVVGNALTVEAEVLPADAVDKSLVWSVENADPADCIAVSDAGVVTATAAGTATIKATAANGVYGEYIVTATSSAIAVTGVELNKETLTMVETDTETLTATVSPDGATDDSVSWTVEDASPAGCVTVSDAGLVTAVAPGTATVKVTTNDGGFTDTCAVTVSQKKINVDEVDKFDVNATTIELQSGYGTGSSEYFAWTDLNKNGDGQIQGNNSSSYKSELHNTYAFSKEIKYVKYTVGKASGNDAQIEFRFGDTVSPEGNAVIVGKGNAKCLLNAVGTYIFVPTAGCTYFSMKNLAFATYLSNIEIGFVEYVAPAVESVTLDQTELAMNVGGDDVTLVPTILPADAEPKSAVWSSDKETVATVTNGVVHAVGEGTANITYTVDGKVGSCVVTVSAAKTFTELTTTGGFRTSYTTSDSAFAIKDLKVYANYNDSSKEEVTDYTVTWSNTFDNTLGGHVSTPTIHWNGHDLALSEVSYSVTTPVQSSVTMAMSCANGDGQPSGSDGSTAFTSATLLSTTQTISKVSYAWSITNAGDLVTAGATENCYIGKGSTMKVGKGGGDGYFNLIFAESVKIKSVKITAYGAADTVKLTVDNAGDAQTIGTTSADYTFNFTEDTNILKITGGAGKTSSNKVAYISSIVVTYEA